ncbi:zinc transport system substrate-binding protein [Nitratiruptor sp. YY08-26]|uniref:metal ABC transporter solute-binding protein, Zn/Mn family n=1 Tax=unclassified Nitratiruptor TaxID=2624044 RepID=UPI0019150C82|nr:MULTISPECIES: zinc ABC transporter substrate-binding protein [unclassified Nitratiruptor]BCD61513.1 zinc transport system substrate-binding protein [Nitratiruptor sp. YY08-13]BCD65447.1 zinc transport system substrate-binding protein [Nitratiruptor sp. YY08-26]
MRFLLFIFFTTLLFAKDTILVSILPQKYFLEQIAKDSFDIEVLISPGASPATYSLKPSQIKKIKKVKCYFTIGVPFEKAWRERIEAANPKLRFIDSGKYIRHYPLAHHHHHEHDEHHEHEKSLDPHIWLAPNLVPLIARAMLDELLKLEPNKKEFFLTNYQKFAQKTIEIDSKIYSLLLQKKSKAFLVYHPSFGYFARSYGLKQLAIEKEGKEPKMQDLIQLAKKAKALGIKTIFIEPQFPKKSAQFLAQKIGAQVKVIDPLAYDWESNILKVARAIAGD